MQRGLALQSSVAAPQPGSLAARLIKGKDGAGALLFTAFPAPLNKKRAAHVKKPANLNPLPLPYSPFLPPPLTLNHSSPHFFFFAFCLRPAAPSLPPLPAFCRVRGN